MENGPGAGGMELFEEFVKGKGKDGAVPEQDGEDNEKVEHRAESNEEAEPYAFDNELPREGGEDVEVEGYEADGEVEFVEGRGVDERTDNWPAGSHLEIVSVE